MSFAVALESATRRPSDPETLANLASAALEHGEEEQALPLLERGVATAPTSRLWQWKGLLERALDEHAAALQSLAAAAELAPSDASIAHAHARVALEAGIDAVPLFERACRIGAPNGDILLGRAAAKFACGRGEEAEAEVAAILARVPLWLQGHAHLAQLRMLMGKAEQAFGSLRDALREHPREPLLWQTLFDLLIRGEHYSELRSVAEQARTAGISAQFVQAYEALAAAELGETSRADELFGEVPAAELPIWRIRHLLRSGRASEAVPLIDAELASERAAEAWPYAALAWRLTNDERFAWLANPRLISTIDLEAELPRLDKVADILRSLHERSGQYFDQSVRGGTQTDGPLFSRLEPEIKAMRAAVVTAVEAYRGQLPDPDPAHPTLSRRADRRIRFSGSWSVLLRGAGFHANHVHPQGWISSALYVAVPPQASDNQDRPGWLALGEPPIGLGLDLAPTQFIEPRPGRLVLFPSWMWHGTKPFEAGERLTIAFDVRPPI